MIEPRQGYTRAHLILLFLALTAAIATGLAIFTSVSAVITLIKTATSGLILPLILSLIVTFLLEPMVKFIEREEIGRTTSIFIVYTLVTLLILAAAAWIGPHSRHLWSSLEYDIPRYTAGLVTFVKDLQINLENRIPVLGSYDLTARIRPLAEQLVGEILVQTPKSALRIGSLLVIVPLFSFFLLRDGDKILRGCISLVPNRYFEMAHDLSYLVSRQMAHFIRGRIIEAFIVGLVVAVGLSFTDIRYAPFLGLIAGVANLIPYIGPIIGMIPGILIAFVDLGPGAQFWWIVIVYILIAQVLVDNFILIPVLISRVSNLHPLLVILAIIMGGKLYGVLGMIIGVPVASIIKIAISEIRQYRRAFSLPDTVAEPDRPS